ncbi:hypothetical protein LB467_17230 [Salegentibacter sp. JZCK2]|uniref:PQQ-dependent sugar dehydrogenase n=1 Tax=Salegentibacter tibetensis TaxID=2873600 RepID=UPI001CC9B570|nr:hypothetical protein [Salegentibacter tibetensis]MBZ9731433.1 hypothetical protein [Salegentibacter tibetensis]
MKKKNFWMCFLAFALIFTSCSEDEKVQDDSELATISFGALLNDMANGRAALKEHLSDIPGCSDASPAFVEVVLTGPTNVGTMEEPLVVQVNPTPGNDGNYFTKESSDLQLQPGIYSLEYFAVYDGNPVNSGSNRIWIAPRNDGSLASFVDNPLPMEIDLRAGVKKYVDVEVLCYDDRIVNEYGYAFFDISTTRGIEFCIFGNYCDENGRHFPAKFSVDAWRYSGDPSQPKGRVIGEDLMNNTGTNSAGDAFADPLCLVLPDSQGADEYYIEITLMDSDVYDTQERIIRSGVITDDDVRSLFRGDSNNEYFHFRAGCDQQDNPDLFGDDNIVQVPEGFRIEKVAGGINRPTSATWDDEGNMFIVLAGNDFLPERDTPMRIMQVREDGSMVEIVDLSRNGIIPAIVGLVWYEGWFYFTHRADDLTGAVSRVNKNGQLEELFSGIIDSQSEHQINDIQVGPDGLMYVSVGPAGNAAVMGPDVAPFVMLSPDVRARPCQDIVLVGRNYKSPDFRTEVENDTVFTGAYVPFGVETQPGQVIQGVTLCGGSILKFDPNNAIGTIRTHAWGFRNLIGLTWDSHGNMYAAENGYDNRGLRPVNDEIDATLRVHEDMWYGVPDFSAGREPLTDPKFEVPDNLQAEVFIGGESIGKDLGFVIDHQASGLTPPDPSVVVGRHEFNSSPSLLDVAPTSWGEWADHLFIAEWGDLTPPTNPLRNTPVGYKVVRVDPESGQLVSFASTMGGGPASAQGMEGEGLERPFDVKFGPDGAMYIIDYGVVTIDFSMAPPYNYHENTGTIWKVSKVEE